MIDDLLSILKNFILYEFCISSEILIEKEIIVKM